MPYTDPVYEKSAGIDMPHSETDMMSKGGDVDTKALGTGNSDATKEEEFEKSVR